MAGTSGRIATVLNFITFCAKKRLDLLLQAAKTLTEGAEDLINTDIDVLMDKINKIIGLTASGNTKFTVELIKIYKKRLSFSITRTAY